VGEANTHDCQDDVPKKADLVPFPDQTIMRFRLRTALGYRSGHVKALGPGGIACVLVFAVGVLAASLASSVARADEASLDGAWNMTAVTESFVVQRWGPPCGPPPVSGTMLPGGTVTILSERGELTIAGARRALRTDECLDAMPTLSRETHSHDGRTWRSRCTTPPSDPRHAVVNTAFFLAPGDDSISVAETGRYEFTISDERCVADVRRASSLLRVGVAPTSSWPVRPASAPTRTLLAIPEKIPAATAPRFDCSTPGESARLEVRPSRKLMRVGETFAFQGSVVDANGCPTGAPIVWSVGPIHFGDDQPHDARPSVDGAGRLTVPQGDFADATFDVIALAAGRAARASVEATSAASFEALLAQSGLDSNGERDEPSVAILATSSIGASRAHAEDGASQRRMTFIVVVGGLSLMLGVVAVVGARRARGAVHAARAAEDRHNEKMREYDRQKRVREQQHAEQMRAHVQSVAIAQQQAAAAAARGIASGPSFCPSCRREFAAGVVFCLFDSNRLVAIAGHEDLLVGPIGGVCPTCKRGFNPGVRVCPHDGEELVPPVIAEAQPGASSPPPRGKICPTCGGRFDGGSSFCAKDGTQLVLLN
jgi:hypothetical protein